MKDRKNSKSVTLALHPGYDTTAEETKNIEQETKQMAKAAGVEEKEIKALNAAVRKVYKSTKNLLTEAKMSMIKKEA